MEFIYKLYLGKEYELYREYTNLKHGFDGEMVWNYFEKVLTVAGLVLFLLGLNWFVRIDDKGNIEISKLFDLKTITYKVDDVANIYHQDRYVSDNGEAKSCDHYVIEMVDGYTWSSRVYEFFSVSNDAKRIQKKMSELGNKVGLKVIEGKTSQHGIL